MNATEGHVAADSAEEAADLGDGADLGGVSEQVAASSAETTQLMEADVSAEVAATEAEMKMVELSGDAGDDIPEA